MAFDPNTSALLNLPLEFAPRIEQTPKGSNVKTEILRLLKEIGPPLQPLLEKMLDYSRAELQAVVEARSGRKDQARLSTLTQFNKERALTENEKAEVEILLDKSEALTISSAAARWLLECRPALRPPLPTPEELEAKFRDAPDSELQAMTRRWFPEDKAQRLRDLVKMESDHGISEAQDTEIEDLLDQITLNAMENATAKLLLKQREMK